MAYDKRMAKIGLNTELKQLSCTELCTLLKAVHFGSDVVGPMETNGVNGRMFALANDSDLKNLGVRLRIKRRDVLQLRTAWDRDGIPNHLWRMHKLRKQEPRPQCRSSRYAYRERENKRVSELKEASIEKEIIQRENVRTGCAESESCDLVRNLSVECVDAADEGHPEYSKIRPILEFKCTSPTTFGFAKKGTNATPRYNWYRVAVSIIDTDTTANKASEKQELSSLVLRASRELTISKAQDHGAVKRQDNGCKAEEGSIDVFMSTGSRCETILEDDWEWVTGGIDEDCQEDFDGVLAVS